MTMFSKDGNIAYYDSKAETFIINKDSDYKNIQKIGNRSLLCFSPSGKYIALSDQNYIDYTHHSHKDWGHQPSGNIFIHAIEEPQVCISQYNDFGDGISGVVYSGKSGRAGNVASVAFSSDEKRLMAVGDDGVIVVRNLHFSDEVNEYNYYPTDDNISFIREPLELQVNFEESMDSFINNQTIVDLNSAISLSNRFRFQRELFYSNRDRMRKAISDFNSFNSMEVARRYIVENFDWDFNAKTVIDFMKLLQQKYLS